ncbi:MAG: thioredoxin family protein [Patescibacteria group bacterium]|nr:thioredoxin family protein [Patescibacteria group bacterium]
MALLEFFGETCPHCIEMHPLVEKLEKELGVQFEKNEVWNNEENAAKMSEYDKGICGGVPFFFNTETKEHICGATSYENLKKWVKGE